MCAFWIGVAAQFNAQKKFFLSIYAKHQDAQHVTCDAPQYITYYRSIASHPTANYALKHRFYHHGLHIVSMGP